LSSPAVRQRILFPGGDEGPAAQTRNSLLLPDDDNTDADTDADSGSDLDDLDLGNVVNSVDVMESTHSSVLSMNA
jgi:hypothetical protein